VPELWDAFADTSTYPNIWSWLKDFQGGPLEPGTVATFRVRPPLPYSLRFVVTIDEVDVLERVAVTVGGDVKGDAQLVLTPTAEGGSQARIAWELELVRPALKRIEPVARRPMVWGHDLVVAQGLRQFRRTVIDDAR